MTREQIINYILEHSTNYTLKQLKSFSNNHLQAIQIFCEDAIFKHNGELKPIESILINKAER